MPNRQATRWLVRTTLGAWALLIATGIYLIVGYRPTASAAYSDMETLRSQVALSIWVRRLHNWVSWIAAALAVGAVALHFRDELWGKAAKWVGVLVATATAWFSGQLLPWDQMALWSVTVGTNLIGYSPIFTDDNVRFVLQDGVEVTTAQLRFWFLVHTLAVPLLAAMVALALRAASRRREAVPRV